MEIPPPSNDPKLSVVMSVYNGERFVAAAIECILAQTYRDFEFIIINDGSTDGSLAIIEDYAARDDRIRVLDQANTGLTVALRRGVEAATGEYIARMDVDDVSLPQRFEKQMVLFAANPDLVAVTTDVQHVSPSGPKRTQSRLERDPRLLPLLFCFENAIGGHGQMIFRRDAYLAAGGYNPEFRYSQDFDLWTRMADVGPFGAVREPLYHWLTDHDNISSRHAEAQSSCSRKIRQTQYRKIVGSDLDDATAHDLVRFIARRAPEQTTIVQSWRLTSAILRAIRVFFRDNPGLAHEKYPTLYLFAATWWWRIKEFATPSPLLRIAFLVCVIRFGMAAVLARALHGTSDFGRKEKA